MNNYKINVEYGTDNLNNILIKVLNNEVKKYLRMICKNDKRNVLIIDTYLSTKTKENSSGR